MSPQGVSQKTELALSQHLARRPSSPPSPCGHQPRPAPTKIFTSGFQPPGDFLFSAPAPLPSDDPSSSLPTVEQIAADAGLPMPADSEEEDVVMESTSSR